MVYQNFSDIAGLIACYIIATTIFMLLFQRKQIRNLWAIIFFLICVISYLTIDMIQTSGPLRMVLEAGPMILPFSFWIFSKALFSDENQSLKQVLSIGVVTLFAYYLIAYILPGLYPSFTKSGALISRIISMVFVLLAIYEAQKGKQTDLIGSRILLRTVFIYIIAITVLITLMAEIGLKKSDQELPRLFQRVFILGLSTFFLIRNTSFKPGFFTYVKRKKFKLDPELIDRILQTMESEYLYRQEKFTIGQLAEHLQEKEYKVREAINLEMGYRNFTDFLNAFRISEARDLLRNPKDREVTVMEIAFQVGFNSIGPFNRAFKDSTGLTPTEFRKLS